MKLVSAYDLEQPLGQLFLVVAAIKRCQLAPAIRQLLKRHSLFHRGGSIGLPLALLGFVKKFTYFALSATVIFEAG